jgi:hypothetical protein
MQLLTCERNALQITAYNMHYAVVVINLSWSPCVISQHVSCGQ